jgi:hypothetical protein
MTKLQKAETISLYKIKFTKDESRWVLFICAIHLRETMTIQ